MHPLVIIIPVAGLIFAPRIWVDRVLKKHNRKEIAGFPSGGALAKQLLTRHGLDDVTVEGSDMGDHYDPKAKAVRLTRDKLERKTLTAVTAAAHEVAHAIQDASNYAPFVWRMRLVNVARTTGQVGTVVLVAVPAMSMFTHQRVPPVFVGATALAMLGTGMAAQLLALPTELDASFGRAMPLLEESFITTSQAKDARHILLASSMTYVASSTLAVLNFWPWLGWWGPVLYTSPRPRAVLRLDAPPPIRTGRRIARAAATPRRHNTSVVKDITRYLGKPCIRTWLRLCKAI